MADDFVLVERLDERVATLILNRPPFNPLSMTMVDALHRALDELERDRAVRAVIVRGAGERAFCAGADIREESQFKEAGAAKAFREYGRSTLHRLENFPKPTIAAIQGWCIGGGTALGWVCDIRLAADNAVFRAGDAYLGIVPSWGMGLLRLPRLVGRGNALDLLLLGDNFSAARAYELGLVSKVVPAPALFDEARGVAARLAKGSPQALAAIRKAVAYNLRHGWDDMVTYEEELCAQVFAHPDAHEGTSAFLEKREPRF
ncbi:MAG TPA: enoyl-CoA hydratase/isomerase family protein, partial [Candidatus Limnocylindria bacterium]|nr:enoyl-CoA hydratase/isomerase family protein [Candidatus Limnocylindria bacterium]